jgi:hypothetical protein
MLKDPIKRKGNPNGRIGAGKDAARAAFIY